MTGPADDGARDGEGPRRFLIATAVSRYPKCAEWNRPGLVQAREKIIKLFTRKLGYQHVTALGLDDPTRAQLTDQLRAFFTSNERREDDLVVVYLSGHGAVLDDGDEHVLLMADTDPADVSYTSLPTADLVRVLRGTRIRRLLLILDTCYSGQGGNKLAAAALERIGAQWGQSRTSSGLVVVSSAQPHQQAKTGLFPHLLAQAVNSQATAGHAPTHLSVSAVVQKMNDHAEKPGYQHISLSLIGLTGEPPDFLTNPRHDVRLTDVDLALQEAAEFDAYALRRETEFTNRLLIRAMGYHGDAAQGWWFCGRHKVLAELANWLNQTDNTRAAHDHDAPRDTRSDVVRVVTAGPGSGKTAVLGLIAALALPERRRTVPVGALGLDERWTPGEGSIDVIMYAQSLTNSEVLGGLAAATSLKSTTVGEFLEALEQQSGDHRRPFTVLIDALDEAATPDTLCSQIVRPLIEHSQGRIRLLLGTRPYLLDRLGIDTAVPAQKGLVIDLDSPVYADRQALLAYTMRNLIQSRRTSPYREWEHHELVQPVARAVADAAGTSFLVARFAAYTLASADTVVTDPYSARWRASLPRHAGQAMRDDLTRRLGPHAQRAADLLRPLAYAEGQGLPWEDIWAPLASAVSGRTYTDADLIWLRHNAGSYVVEASENGRSAYRLYHQALTEHLREDTDAPAVHSAFVDTLTDCVPYRGDATRDWSRAHPYTLNHLATHAAAAGRIDDILKDTEYLVHAVPYALTPHLQHATSGQGRLTAAVYRTAFDLHATAPAPVRRNALALNAARAGATELLEHFNRHTQPGEWVPVWATGNDFTPALRNTLPGHGAPVNAIASTTLNGHPIALTGTGTGPTTSDGALWVWDLATGRQIGEPLRTPGRSRVNAIACTTLNGHPIAVTATSDGSVGYPGGDRALWVWDLATGRQIGEPLRTPGGGTVDAVVCTTHNDRPIAIAVSSGTMWVWDLTTGQVSGPRHPPGGGGAVDAVACTTFDGHPLVIAAITGGSLWVWDLATGRQIGEPLRTPGSGRVKAIACTTLNSHPIAIAVTSSTNTRFGSVDEGVLCLWDLVTGRQVGEPLRTPGSGPVSAIACTTLNGHPIAVTSTGDLSLSDEYRVLWVWDLATGRQIGEPLRTPGSGRVKAIACATLNDHPVAVAGGGTGPVRLWDLPERSLPTKTNTGPADVMTAVACTAVGDRPVAVLSTSLYSSGDNSVLWVWDLATGRQISEPFRIPDGGQVDAVACSVLTGHPIAVIGTSNGFSSYTNPLYVWVWDLATGRQIG
ncbi:caspase family protein, partial [Streptomyces mirabilis]|uniref:caspase family protein n=1 Tax=Streptomyces mirabilis TaxID=68239 RepID=UPI0033341960